MDKLYGDAAEAVFARMENLDPTLNRLIQSFAYDEVWELPPLSMREKSLITVAALAAQNRPEQLRMHMRGFLNCAGSISELRAVLVHLALYCGFPAALAGFAVLADIEAERE